MLNDINDINQCITYEGQYIDGERVIEEVDPLNNRRCVATIPKRYEGNTEYEIRMRKEMRSKLKQ